MRSPKIELFPLRRAVRSDGTTGLDVFVRVTAPRSSQDSVRPAVNLGLVLDNSGSMQGKKIDYARKAAIFTVNQLLPTDRVSVTTFNSRVRTPVPSSFVTNKTSIVSQIEQIDTNFKTALHPGWVEGSKQVLTHLIGDGINRILLLSDGQANKGQTDPKAIADEVRELAARGVSTTTMGVGDDFNEDLMESMARAGGGNYHYIDSPNQLPKIFQDELEDMMMTVVCRVSLGFEPRNGVTVLRVLNDYETNSSGQYMLPNVVAGKSIGAMVQLNVPRLSSPKPAELCHVCLEWDANRAVARSSLGSRVTSVLTSSPGLMLEGGTVRQTHRVRLALPAVTFGEWNDMAEDPVAKEQWILITNAHKKREAVHALDAGNLATARSLLDKSRLAASSIVATPDIEKELEDIAAIEADLERGALEKVHKRAKQQSWSRLSSSSIIPSPLIEGD